MDWGKAFTVVALMTGFSMRLVSTLFLENLCIACDALRNMDFEQYTERDRCFKPDKLEQALMEFFSLDWTELHVQTYELLAETLPTVVMFRLCGEYARILLICDPFEGAQVRMNVTYSLGEEE